MLKIPALYSKKEEKRKRERDYIACRIYTPVYIGIKYYCSECGSGYTSKAGLRKHLASVHDEIVEVCN